MKKYGQYQHNFDFFQKCSVSLEESQEINGFNKFLKIRSQLPSKTFFDRDKEQKIIFKAIFLRNLTKKILMFFKVFLSLLENE